MPRALPPIMRAKTVSMFSASRARSSRTPISTNSGTAISRLLDMMPQTRAGKNFRKERSKTPKRLAITAVTRGAPAMASMAGMPLRMPVYRPSISRSR